MKGNNKSNVVNSEQFSLSAYLSLLRIGKISAWIGHFNADEQKPDGLGKSVRRPSSRLGAHKPAAGR